MIWEAKQKLFFIKIILWSSLSPALEQWAILEKGVWARLNLELWSHSGNVLTIQGNELHINHVYCIFDVIKMAENYFWK